MIVLAFIALALAASATATGYIDGHEYVYRYHTLYHTSYPKSTDQKTGYGGSTTVHIQPHGDEAIFWIDESLMSLYSGEFEDVKKINHNYRELPEQANFLKLPFRVHRKNGIVTHFEVAKDEPSFSVNVKRGFIYLFNLNLEKINSGASTEGADPNPHFYSVYEETAVGECEITYLIEHHPYEHSRNPILNVTKGPNFHRCKSRPNQVYSVFHGHECGEAEHEKSHTLHGNSHLQYSLRGDRHHYIIEKIETDSSIAYTPYPLEGGTVTTDIKRSLELIEERAVTTSIELPADLVTHTSLLFDFDFQKDFTDPVNLKDPHYLYYFTGYKTPISDIQKQIEELVDAYTDETYTEKIKDKNYPIKFLELIRSTSTLGYDDIEQLYKLYADIPIPGVTEQQMRHRNLFVDTLVNLGTNPAFLFGKHLVESNKFQLDESVYFVRQLQFHLKEVSETLLDSFQELCDHANVKTNSKLHIACVTALSNVVFDHCVSGYHPEGQGVAGIKHTCSQEAAVKYFNYIAQLYEKTRNRNLKLHYIKVAGNFGVKEIIPYLEPYIAGKGNFTKFERVIAVWAVRNTGFKYTAEVRSLLVPLLFNRTESHDLRIPALVILLMYRPQMFAVEALARALINDPNDQLKSHAYSILKYLANSTHPCDRQLSKSAHHALRILEDFEEFEQYDISYSHLHYSQGYDGDFDLGSSTLFGLFASDSGNFPRTLYLGTEEYIGGKTMPTLAMGVTQFGLEKFWDRLAGPEGLIAKKSIFDIFKKLAKRDTTSSKELHDIKEKMKLAETPYDDINGEIFLNYMGNEFVTIFFDEHIFDGFFKEGHFVIPNIPAFLQKIPEFTYHRFLLTVDKMYVIPTELGVPLMFDYKEPVYTYYKNKESGIKVEPGFFSEDRGGQFPDNIKADINGHLAVDKNLIAYVGTVAPYDMVYFGAGINRRSTLSLPLKLKFDLDIKEKKFKTNWIPVAPHEIYHFKYEPFTFVDSYINVIPLAMEDGYVPVQRMHRHETENSYFHDILGVGFNVKSDYENEFNDFGSWADFLLKKGFREALSYVYANPHFEPYHIDVQFSYADNDATREVDTAVTCEFYDTNWIIPHFPEEKFEDYDEKKEGRNFFYTYVLKFDLHGKGGKERKLHAVTTWTKDIVRSFHKVNFFYERTPFAPSETADLKICGSSYVKYPIHDFNKLFTSNLMDIEDDVHAELKVHFGRNCDSEQKFMVQGVFSKTDEQYQLENRRNEQVRLEHHNPYSYNYHQCLKEMQSEVEYATTCLKYMLLRSLLHKYTFHIKHENLSPSFLNKTYLLDRVLKFALYTHSDHNEVGVMNPTDEVHIEANFSLNLPVADIRVRKPTSDSNYYNVYFPRYSALSSHPRLEAVDVIDSFGEEIYCGLDGNKVFTFDRYKYTIPPTDCYKLFAMDCTVHEDFAVFVINTINPEYRKAIKIFIGKHTIDASFTSEDSDLQIRVDGQDIPFNKEESYLHNEEDHLFATFYITYRGGYYTFNSERYGLVIGYTREWTYMLLSPYYRAKPCGLCGNYNGLKYDGGTTPEGCYYKDAASYAYTYYVPSETCSVPEPELICPVEGI